MIRFCIGAVVFVGAFLWAVNYWHGFCIQSIVVTLLGALAGAWIAKK